MIERRKARRSEKQRGLNLGLSGRASFDSWLKPEDVVKVTVSNVMLGKGYFGKVYVGRVYFKDGIVKRVAVKRFSVKLTNQVALVYEKIIKDLVSGGAPLPKMGMVKLKKGTRIVNGVLKQDEWVQVSQLFGGTVRRKTILKRGICDLITRARTASELNEIADIFASFINGGYVLPWDSLEYIRTRHGPKLVPFDIDLIGRQIADMKTYGLSPADLFLQEIDGHKAYVQDKAKINSFIERLLEKITDPFLRTELRKKIIP